MQRSSLSSGAKVFGREATTGRITWVAPSSRFTQPSALTFLVSSFAVVITHTSHFLALLGDFSRESLMGIDQTLLDSSWISAESNSSSLRFCMPVDHLLNVLADSDMAECASNTMIKDLQDSPVLFLWIVFLADYALVTKTLR